MEVISQTQKQAHLRSRQKFNDTLDKAINLYWLVVSVANSSVYTHTFEWSYMHVKDPVVHIGVQRITETPEDYGNTG